MLLAGNVNDANVYSTANTYYKLHEDMSFSERELALFT